MQTLFSVTFSTAQIPAKAMALSQRRRCSLVMQQYRYGRWLEPIAVVKKREIWFPVTVKIGGD